MYVFFKVWCMTENKKCRFVLCNGVGMIERFWAHMDSAKISYACGSTHLWWRWLNSLAIHRGCFTSRRYVWFPVIFRSGSFVHVYLWSWAEMHLPPEISIFLWH
jgi:hypothetical protein